MIDIIQSERETENKDITQLNCSRKQDLLTGKVYRDGTFQLIDRLSLHFLVLTARIHSAVNGCLFLFCLPSLPAVCVHFFSSNVVCCSSFNTAGFCSTFFAAANEGMEPLLQLPPNKDSSHAVSLLQGLALTEMPVCAAHLFTRSPCFRGGGN